MINKKNFFLFKNMVRASLRQGFGGQAGRLLLSSPKGHHERSSLFPFALSLSKDALLLCFFLINISLSGMNLLLRPYDTLIRPTPYFDRCGELSIWAEGGVRTTAYNGEGHQVNIFNIWNRNQNALAMLDGFGSSSPITDLFNRLDAIDDGIRGHVLLNGKMHYDFGGAIGGRWYFLPHAWLTAYIPFYRVRLTDFSYTDLTLDNTSADLRVRNMLTTPLQQVIAQFGDGLQLGGWRRTGAGDMNLLVEFMFDFPQNRTILKEVEIDGRAGFTLPTGLKADPDRLLAFSFGYDGAVGIVWGGGLKVLLDCYVAAGIDVQLLHLFGNTRTRRIKTHIDQSDILLLAKTPTYIDYGLTQRFNLFLQAYKFYRGLSFLVGYQFLKKGEDHLALNSCDYSTTIANTAVSLDEWIVHSIELNMHYDFTQECDGSAYAPQASLFARIPFNGKRSIAFTTVGIMVAVDF